MKKKVFGKYFSRAQKARTALYRSLVLAMVTNGRIDTTLAKAKVLSKYLEKQLVIAKRGTLSARREVLANLGNDKKTVKKIFVLATTFTRKNGFTKIIALPPRLGDGAKMATIEFIEKIPSVTVPTGKVKTTDKKSKVKGSGETERKDKKIKVEKPELVKKMKKIIKQTKK